MERTMNPMKLLAIVALSLFVSLTARAQRFDEFFTDSTLRLNYIFAGDRAEQRIYLDELEKTPRWYGRRMRLGELPLKGDGQITVADAASGKVIYRHSFSSLFQEWLTTTESHSVAKSFENVFLVPFPKEKVSIKVELFDYRERPITSLTHTVDPRDILIRRTDKPNYPYVTMQQAADTAHCIHFAYVAEGYTEDQMDDFLRDVRMAMEALFAHEPFKSLRPRFNIVAVKSPSLGVGTSHPGKGIWNKSALQSHFDTFYSARYLTTLHMKRLNDALDCIPYEHIIVLVNSPVYGGGGIYNSYTISTMHNERSLPVVVHEFGHSFGGLADEYEYSEDDPQYFPDIETWRPNITTQCDFSKKWENLVKEGKAGLVEGGGYQRKGVWRGCPDCRMRTNEVKEFCPVCQQALTRLIDFYTVE